MGDVFEGAFADLHTENVAYVNVMPDNCVKRVQTWGGSDDPHWCEIMF
jgi:hypothetical protein